MSILLGAAKLINTLSVLTGMSYKLSETRDAVIERAFDAYWELENHSQLYH